MAYASFVEFRAALLQTIVTTESMSDARIDILYSYYQHALRQSSLILGRLDDIKPLVGQHGTAFEGGSGALFVTPEGYSKEMSDQQGKKWSIIRNDCFILGGIHGHATFYLKTKDLDALNRVNDKNEFVFNVTQRELIGLITFGYSQGNASDPRGVEFKCTDPGLADTASFRAYHSQVQELVGALRS
jgi:hypothetical protein